VKKLGDADAMLNAGKDDAAVLQALEVNESTYLRWRNQYGGMKSEEAKRLKRVRSAADRCKVLKIGPGGVIWLSWAEAWRVDQRG
jgi:hypothetical protein